METANVSGVVKLDGKPLSLGLVIFTPELGRAATGPIQADGSYTLGTYKPGDGALVGKHCVTVLAREESAGGTAGSPLVHRGGKSLIPLLYGDSAKSPLRYEVKPGQANVYSIDLSSAAKPIGP